MNDKNDPKDSPITRHVLYTNDVTRMVASFVQGLLTVARPERVKAAMEAILGDWDRRVAIARHMADSIAESTGEPSTWREPGDEEN